MAVWKQKIFTQWRLFTAILVFFPWWRAVLASELERNSTSEIPGNLQSVSILLSNQWVALERVSCQISQQPLPDLNFELGLDPGDPVFAGRTQIPRPASLVTASVGPTRLLLKLDGPIDKRNQTSDTKPTALVSLPASRQEGWLLDRFLIATNKVIVPVLRPRVSVRKHSEVEFEIAVEQLRPGNYAVLGDREIAFPFCVRESPTDSPTANHVKAENLTEADAPLLWGAYVKVGADWVRLPRAHWNNGRLSGGFLQGDGIRLNATLDLKCERTIPTFEATNLVLAFSGPWGEIKYGPQSDNKNIVLIKLWQETAITWNADLFWDTRDKVLYHKSAYQPIVRALGDKLHIVSFKEQLKRRFYAVWIEDGPYIFEIR